MVWMSRR